MLVKLLSVILRLASAVFDDPCAGATARSRQDPHLDLAHGGSADFRGKQGWYNYLSTPGLSVNARFEEALYTLHDGLLLVNGTFMTEVHVAALVAGDAVCKWAYVSYHASELNQQNWGWRAVKTSCGGSEVTLGPNRNRTCGGLITSVKLSSATIAVNPSQGSVEGAPWRIIVHGDKVHRVSGPTHRLDIEFSYLSQSSADAHGLIGQSIADPLPRYGRLDVYPDSGKFGP